jgi:hypothetical protein
MLNNRKLPIGIQDFEDLRTNNYVYVDKTAYLYRLVNWGKPYFLCRPRRFGKSLFLSTLKAYFLGKKELFEGLAIACQEKDWQEYPIIYIDLNKAIYNDKQTLNNVLDEILRKQEASWGITDIASELSLRFDNLIQTVYTKTDRKVVVLVDEYDKPLVNTLDKKDVNEELRDVLKGFYGILKSADACLRFVMLTGVTKFSKVSVFSDLNHLVDISMNENYAGICGISESELTGYFQPEIENLAERRKMTYEHALAELKKRYDGYHFVKESEGMYNPFSLLNALDQKDFSDYWFATGTPTFLVKMLKEGSVEIPDLEYNIPVAVSDVTDYKAEYHDPVPLLYQSGYLTIKDYDAEFDELILGFPNEEVKYGFLKELLPAYVPQYTTGRNFSAVNFIKTLRSGDINAFMNNLQAFYASISYDLKDCHRSY